MALGGGKMAWQTLGKITIVTSGTKVQITSAHVPVHAIFIQQNPANTHKIFVGLSTMNQATLAGVLAILPPPTTTSFPAIAVSPIGGPNALDLADIYVDVAAGGDGESVVVSYLEN